MILINKNTGDKYTLQGKVFTVGSGSVNNLVLQGEQIRKIHFQILKQGDQFQFIAMNGNVDCNGELKPEGFLNPGDTLSLGGIVLGIEASAPPAPIVNPINMLGFTGNAYEILLEKVIGLIENPDKQKSTEDILNLALELMTADGGYLFALEGNDLRLIHSVPQDNPNYSHSAVNAAFKKRETLIWSASEEQEEVSAQSVAQKHIYSILVAPLLSNGAELSGLVYLHRNKLEKAFTEDERKLFSKISQALGAIWGSNRKQMDQAEQLQSLKAVKGAGQILFACEEMKKVLEMANRAANSAVPVLIAGETGTGKDVLANYVHSHSLRERAPFVAINCGAIPEHLIESELFGHEKGAYTGAANMQKGLFEQANGGTLFLDEVGELPLHMQVKFLRALQSGLIRRIGGTEEIPVDVRVIAATHRNLLTELQAGRFREDLYYRLNLVQLTLPPLREREGDVLLLAEHILKKACVTFNMNNASLSKAAEKALLKYPWPGNIRELENKLQKALLNSNSRILDVETLELPTLGVVEPLSLKSAREQAESRAIQSALTKAKGNLTLAATFLGIDRKVLRDIMERLGVHKENFKSLKNEDFENARDD